MRRRREERKRGWREGGKKEGSEGGREGGREGRRTYPLQVRALDLLFSDAGVGQSFLLL